jgi:signal transduction histidine kinase
MKFFRPGSITGRTMIVLLVGLTLSHILSMLFLAWERRDSMAEMEKSLSLERIEVAARLLNRAPQSERPELAWLLSSPNLAVSWSDEPVVAPGMPAVPALPFETGVRRSDEHPADGVLARTLHGIRGHVLGPLREYQPLEASARLSDGSWVNIEVGGQRAVGFWSPHMIASTLVMVVAIVVLGAWVAGWVGRPLAAFAMAADRLGRDVNAPPLPEGGPSEIRFAVTAFNRMQGRIRRFVEDRTRMLAAISHDLRSPITRMRLRAEMLADGEPRERMLADLGEMETMVSSSLDFARSEANDESTQVVDLAATIGTICDNAADIGLAANFEWAGRLACTCRPTALKRALTNLVENAARYGGRASVHAGRVGPDIEIVIEDDGPGIPEADFEKVFKPFFRLEGSRNRNTGGIGLGLTVARTIVRAHGGDIRLENRQTGGLRVSVLIPQGQAT